jgi:hypothetical protein
MRKIITTTFVTMDGVMQAPGGPEEDTSGGFRYGGWQAKVMDDSLGDAINEFLKPPFAMLLAHYVRDLCGLLAEAGFEQRDRQAFQRGDQVRRVTRTF